MRFNQGDFFQEKEDNEVTGFTIIETSSGSGPHDEHSESYRIAEKWEPHGADNRWITYWIPAERLHERVDAGKCLKSAETTEKQFRGVLNLADVSVETPSAASPSGD